MSKKQRQIIVPLAPAECFYLLLSIGGGLEDWKVEKSDNTALTIVFKQGSLFSTKSKSPVQTSIFIIPLTEERTQTTFIAKHYGLADPFGFLDRTLNKLIEPFQIQAARHKAGSEGKICPECSREAPMGAKYCPYDGTPIMQECPKCKYGNASRAKFCSNCGKKFIFGKPFDVN